MTAAEKQFVVVVVVAAQNGRNLFIINQRIAVFCGVLAQKAKHTTAPLLWLKGNTTEKHSQYLVCLIHYLPSCYGG
jgi:hypothetical protein